MKLEINTFTLQSAYDGLPLTVAFLVPGGQNSEPAAAPRAIVQLVHGMCEHKERYYPLMQYLVSNGFICVIHDHRGHGGSVRSADDLGYFYEGGYRAAVEDTHQVTQWAKENFPGLPLFLFGHSMGSMVVRSYTKKYDGELSGLIVCGSPSKNPAAGAGILLARLCGIFGGSRCRPALIQNIAFGSYNNSFPDAKSPNSWICSNEDIVHQYDADPLCNYRFTANGFENLFALMQDTYSSNGWKVSKPDLPIYFIAGANDPCITSEKRFGEAVRFMSQVGYRNVGSKLYPGMRHEIHNETAKADVWKDIADTLESWIQ